MRRWEPSGGTTTTTTTIGCVSDDFYAIDIYAASNSACPLCDACEALVCAECDTIQLEYSTDGGTNWNPERISFDTVTACAYVGTFNINICETSLMFRIISQNRCGGPIYFAYAANSSTCPTFRIADCGNCTDSETTNVMPTGNTSIAFTICTECFNNCCSACCV
jgi:hypothetical protein